MHPRAATHPNQYRQVNKASLYSMLSDEHDPITGAEAVAFFFSDHSEPKSEDSWSRHYALRLAYENQMLEAQGGRLEQCEVLPGGKLGGRLILKVSKSNVTGRATSCDILGPKVSGWAYQVSNIPGTEYAAYHMDLERLSPDAYKPPTPESLAELAAFKKSCKDAAPKKDACPLINPTDADAERLQAMWNEKKRLKGEAKRAESKYAYCPELEGEPSKVCRITQAQYTANSGRTYSKAETSVIEAGGKQQSGYQRHAKEGKPVCKIRTTSGENYKADRVIIITDKPQKPLPAAVWTQPQPTAELVNA